MRTLIAIAAVACAGSVFAADVPVSGFPQASIDAPAMTLEGSARTTIPAVPFLGGPTEVAFGYQPSLAAHLSPAFKVENGIITPIGDVDPKMVHQVAGSCDPGILRDVPSPSDSK